VVFAQHLDRNGNIKDQNIKVVTDGIYRNVKAILDELSFRVAAYTPDELKEYILRKLSGAGSVGNLDFFEYAERYIDRTCKEQPGTAANQRVALNNLARYLGERRLALTSLTSNFLYKYLSWMEKSGGAGSTPLGERGQSLYLGNIRTIFNAAQREYNDYDRGEIPIPNRPFERFKIKKARSIKTAEQKALSIAQIRAIRGYTPTRKVDELARDCFMLSFYLCGMNSVDLYRCSELIEGAVRYYRAKVTGRRDDRAEMRVRVEPEAQPLVDKYAGKGIPEVFDFCQRYTHKDKFNAALNNGLKAVGKAAGVEGLSFYYARHSWATIAANACGIPIDTVDDCLAHSDSRMAKKAYIKKDWTKIYDANRMVLDAIR
jgi:integrase